MFECYVLSVEIPTPSVMLLGGRAFGRYKGDEGGALMNEISALIKQTPRELPHPFHHLRTQQEDASYEKGPHWNVAMPALTVDFEPPELWATSL